MATKRRTPKTRTAPSRLQPVNSGGPVTWHNLTKPNQDSLAALKKLHPFLLEEDLQDCLPPFERPKLLHRGQYLFAVLLFPVVDPATGTTVPYEVDFFIGKDFVVTSHQGHHPTMSSLADACNADTGSCPVRPGDTPLRLALDIIHGLTVSCFPMVTRLSNELIGVERGLFREDGDTSVTKHLLRIRTSVVGFRKAMHGSDHVLRKLLMKAGDLFPVEDYRHQVEDITMHAAEIREFLENDRETVSALYDAHLSLVSLRAAQATKTLTALAFIIFPMTLVAAIFSMRAEHMPILGHRDDFWIMLAAIFLTMTGAVTLLKRKRWL